MQSHCRRAYANAICEQVQKKTRFELAFLSSANELRRNVIDAIVSSCGLSRYLPSLPYYHDPTASGRKHFRPKGIETHHESSSDSCCPFLIAA